MISSRQLEDLLPKVQEMAHAFIAKCHEQGIDLLVTSTYRDNESQDKLFAQGRTQAGAVVTNARGGESFHNYRCAMDVVPIINGKPDWNGSHPAWKQVGQIGKDCGFEWAGDWEHFRELAHFQYTGGLTLTQLKAGNPIV